MEKNVHTIQTILASESSKTERVTTFFVLKINLGYLHHGNWYLGGSRPGVATWLKSSKNIHDSPATTTKRKMHFWVSMGNWYPGGPQLVLAKSAKLLKHSWQPRQDHVCKMQFPLKPLKTNLQINEHSLQPSSWNKNNKNIAGAGSGPNSGMHWVGDTNPLEDPSLCLPS